MAQDSAAPGRQPGLSVCIIAYKDLSRNTRVARQAAALAQAGHRVTVVGFGVPDLQAAAAENGTTAIAAGIPAYPKSLMTVLDVARRALPLPRGAGLRLAASGAVAAQRNRTSVFARRAAALLAGRSFDVIQAHDEKALIAAAAVRRRCGGRLVYDVVEVPFDDEKLPKWPVARAVRLAEMRREIDIACSAEGWVTVNQALADDIADRFRVPPPLVLRNCQHDGNWPSDGRLRRDLGLSEQVRLLLHLNTLRPGEGVETVIDALAGLPHEVHFAALGPEGERGFVARMRQHAAERGVAERFHVPPLQPVHAIPAYAAGADIGVIARQGVSRNNRLSLPNRLFQMIGARLPVAATPLPEIARLVHEWRLGRLFDEDDAGALAAAVGMMMEPAALAGFRRAVDRAASALIWERESAPYVRMIETLGSTAWSGSSATRSRRPLRGLSRTRISFLRHQQSG